MSDVTHQRPLKLPEPSQQSGLKSSTRGRRGSVARSSQHYAQHLCTQPREIQHWNEGKLLSGCILKSLQPPSNLWHWLSRIRHSCRQWLAASCPHFFFVVGFKSEGKPLSQLRLWQNFCCLAWSYNFARQDKRRDLSNVNSSIFSKHPLPNISEMEGKLGPVSI